LTPVQTAPFPHPVSYLTAGFIDYIIPGHRTTKQDTEALAQPTQGGLQ
jgi:hypothetical protein